MDREATNARRIRRNFFVLSLLFAVSFSAGAVAPAVFRRQMAEVFNLFAFDFRSLSGGALFFNILVRNVVGTIFVLVSGVAGGVVPVIAVGSNGFGLGVLFRQAVGEGAIAAGALKVLPYGFFEIPALLVSASYGLWLGGIALRNMRGTDKILLRFPIEHAFRRYFAVVFPLLVVAAGLETALFLWLTIRG
ncbi:MAG: stage II sporulation protein M [Deltaproteobacteria bacterium]